MPTQEELARQNVDKLLAQCGRVTNGRPKGEHNQAHQYPSPQRGNADSAWPSHSTSAFLLPNLQSFALYGIAGFGLVRFWFWLKSKAAGVIKILDNSTPDSFRECSVQSRRRALPPLCLQCARGKPVDLPCRAVPARSCRRTARAVQPV